MVRRALAALIVVVAARAARADGPLTEVVTTQDGSVYQGELVEKVVDDHITLKLADGTLHRFAWKDVQIGAPAAQALPAPASFGAPAPEGGAYVSWPEPERRPPPLTRPHLLAGIEAGIGGPEGYFGVTAGWEPTGWLELEVGAGLGGTFGPALAQTLRLGLPILGTRIGVGVGFSENFTGKSQSDQGAPSMSKWLNVESYGDVVLGRQLLLRFVMGFGFLLDSGDFAILCRGPQPPTDCSDWGIPSTPESAGGGWAFDLYGSVRVAWLFDI